MIRGIGVDMVEVERMARLLGRYGDRVERRLFTPGERSRCRRCARVAQCYAARFAAKEAALKALGTGLAGGISWQDLEVESPDDARPPAMRLEGAARDRLRSLAGARGVIHLTLTHDGGHAVAVAVAEGRPEAD